MRVEHANLVNQAKEELSCVVELLGRSRRVGNSTASGVNPFEARLVIATEERRSGEQVTASNTGRSLSRRRRRRRGRRWRTGRRRRRRFLRGNITVHTANEKVAA